MSRSPSPASRLRALRGSEVLEVEGSWGIYDIRLRDGGERGQEAWIAGLPFAQRGGALVQGLPSEDLAMLLDRAREAPQELGRTTDRPGEDAVVHLTTEAVLVCTCGGMPCACPDRADPAVDQASMKACTQCEARLGEEVLVWWGRCVRCHAADAGARGRWLPSIPLLRRASSPSVPPRRPGLTHVTDHYVRGYFRRDGTYVQGHGRRGHVRRG